MRNQTKGLGKAISTAAPYAVLLIALVVGIEVAAISQTDNAIAGAVQTARLGVANQLDRLDRAICDALAQLEYACTRGLVASRI